MAPFFPPGGVLLRVFCKKMISSMLPFIFFSRLPLFLLVNV
jgi:hypothetical protein